MYFTVADARPLVAPYVGGGVCTSSTEVLARINECTQRLLAQRDWAFTVRWLRFFTRNNTITMPRGVARVIGDPVIDGTPRRTFTSAYEFMENGPGEVPCSGNGLGADLLDMDSYWPTFFDPPGGAEHTLVAFSKEEADAGKEISFLGRDQYDAAITTDGSIWPKLKVNRWSAGVEGAITGPLDELEVSSVKVKEITSLRKPVTKGHVSLYTLDTVTGRMYFLSKFTPRETQPQYRRYRITNPDFENGMCVLLRVKLDYEPAESDYDVLLIQNLAALKLMAQSIAAENSSRLQEAVGFATLATAELERMTRNVNPGTLNIQVTDLSAGRNLPIGCII